MRLKSLGKSMEYFDNRTPLYCAQGGKCAVNGQKLEINEIHYHHKVLVSLGGDDSYQNLIIIYKDVHKLIHSTAQDTILRYLRSLDLTLEMIIKVNRFRKLANLNKNFETCRLTSFN